MEKFKFTRDGIEKECHCHEGVYEKLLEEGWKPLDDKPKEVEQVTEEAPRDVLDRDTLKAEADALGIEYPKNIKTERLYELVYSAKAE